MAWPGAPHIREAIAFPRQMHRPALGLLRLIPQGVQLLSFAVPISIPFFAASASTFETAYEPPVRLSSAARGSTSAFRARLRPRTARSPISDATRSAFFSVSPRSAHRSPRAALQAVPEIRPVEPAGCAFLQPERHDEFSREAGLRGCPDDRDVARLSFSHTLENGRGGRGRAGGAGSSPPVPGCPCPSPAFPARMPPPHLRFDCLGHVFSAELTGFLAEHDLEGEV